MGAHLSLKSSERDEEDISIPAGDVDFSVLDDLWADILVFIPTVDLLNCRAVCKRWKELIDGHCIWKSKCERENRYIPPAKFKGKLPENYYRMIYLFDPYNRNLIKNPFGQDGLEGWSLIHNDGDGFRVEEPPGGADPVPSEVGTESCFATSFFPCKKLQCINLCKEGISSEVLRLNGTKIQVGEWYSARFDCAAEYIITVSLFSDGFRLFDNYSHEACKVDEFTFTFREVQWAGKEWHKVTHEFDDVGDVRYVLFEHYGKDLQFWAGHYGTKMTGAFVKVIVGKSE